MGSGQSYGRTSGNEEEAPMMWPANNAGSMYSFQTYSKTPLMLSMLGGIVGDAEVQQAMSEYTQGVELQASVAVGLHQLHEQGARPGPELVLVLLAVDDRVGRRIDCRRQHGGRARRP